MQPRTVRTILQDLSKIEYALRAEDTHCTVRKSFAESIITLYQHCIMQNQYDVYLTPDILSDIYDIVFRYMSVNNPYNKKVAIDIQKRMQSVLTVH